MNLRWYAHYLQDYEDDTRDLTMQQDGCYRRLIDHCYKTGEALPANLGAVQRIARAFSSTERKDVASVLNRYFVLEDNGYCNKRVDEELQRAAGISKKRSNAAYKKHANAHASADANAPAIAPAKADTVTVTSTEERIPSLRSGTPPSQVDEQSAIEAYNAVAEELGWAVAQKISGKRRASLKRRLADSGGLHGWLAAMAKARASPFLRGETGRTSGHEDWKPDLDFFLQETSFTKLMEGKYDRSGRTKTTRNGAHANFAAGARAILDELGGPGDEDGCGRDNPDETGVPLLPS